MGEQVGFMYGRVHPYTLTWRVEPGDGLETADGPQDYSIPRAHGPRSGLPIVRPSLPCAQAGVVLTYVAALPHNPLLRQRTSLLYLP